MRRKPEGYDYATYNKLLLKLEKGVDSLSELNNYAFQLQSTLLAVVEMHKPHPSCCEGCGVAGWCEACVEPPYPCPTIQVITKELL